MQETVGFSFYTSSVETYFVDPEQGEVSPKSEKTTCIAGKVFDPMGEVVELYKEMRNEGFLKRDNVVIIKENALFKNVGAIQVRENLRIECKEIESTGTIEAKSAELTAGKVYLLGNHVLVRADEILIRANEIVVDSAQVEGHLKLEGCERLEVRNLSEEAMRVWEEAAPEGCTFVASTAFALEESQEEAAAEELVEVQKQTESEEALAADESVDPEMVVCPDEQVESEEACVVEE